MRPRYSLWNIPAPKTGTWQLADLSDQGTWPPGSESRAWGSFVSALVHNPGSDCLANVSKTVVNDGQSITISVTPFSAQPLGTGASVSGYMLRPDQVQVPLTFQKEALGDVRTAVIPPSQYVGQGTYTVTARCDVADGALRDEGENPPHNDDHQEMPVPAQNVLGFTRQVTKTFWVVSNTQPGLPGTVTLAPGQVDRGASFWGDADGDGIPNAAEPPGDYDGDGLPNNRDSDADGDETPDNIDTSIVPPPGTLPQGDGFIVYERWNNIGNGTSVSDIPLSTPPNFTANRTELRAPSNVADNYGARMRGWVTAPTTGPYTFWISGDDNVALYFSTTGLPGSKQRIAYDNSYTGELEWNKFPTQKSAAITLSAGKRYYIEALLKESSGTDSLAVGWLKPGETGSSPSEVIPGRQLSPYTAPVIPPGQTACASQALSRVSASASSQESSSYPAANAIDGNLSTRWSSQFSDPQSLTIDLGQVRYVNRVKLTWETSRSADYDIRVSSDNVNFQTIYTNAHGGGSVDDITTVSTTARYVRMFSRARTTQYGNSLFEMEVFGDTNLSCFAVLGSRFEEAPKVDAGCHIGPTSNGSDPPWLLWGALASGMLIRRQGRRSPRRHLWRG